MSYYDKKSILLTGAASGLGRLFSQQLTQHNCHLFLVDRDEAGLAKLKDELPHAKISLFTCDFTNLSSVENFTQQIKELEIDILINNAGIVSGRPFTELSNENIINTYMVNSIVPMILTKAVITGMIKRDQGHIVNICSAASFVGVAKLSDYAASKAAISSFDESLRLELSKLNSKVVTTAFCPYYINTGMFDGVKTRFPSLLPILDPKRVISRLDQAIANKENRVILPWFIYASLIIKILPPKIFDLILTFFGINSSMDDFKGRTK
ncbi:MAG: SDR family NAD(P)-dependent oxidoreductase [Bdellovibrionales bacterium]|jgi:all-trans-retinol dehydrogenase (NAD+)|nr:SDR family NAD(P)-dependent oxidoreductase [Bdellovibrionales bacterium]MBT3524908.1 SDR family NAD(P)-dependent oxidoreductase [Bdellovibrionales bacterium]MBT7669171.1 SDR family NAD(P)-dependent oxidoreductase [Bdellovibrionales bacterium]MBT7766796.1 SDR family NAD(P)-dependent oxidoreductase [Bdellovibrionales bacterium]